MESGYNVPYCENPAPCEPDKTCRQVGSHRKKRHLNGTDDVPTEYSRVANRLKGQKLHGTLLAGNWNLHIKTVQDHRETAITGWDRVAKLRERYDGISQR